MVEIGTLYGISVGPGDPELLTLKGLRLLKNATVVAFPSGISNKPGIAQQIVAEWVHPDQVQLSLHFPYVQDMAELTQAWQMAANQVWDYLQQGQDVAFVCEGDVSFYSTFTYLAQTLQQCYPLAKVEAIPGVCSPLAAAASLGIPLSLRSQKIVVLPALYNVEELKAAVQWAEVIVLLKVSSVYQQVWEILQTHQLLDRSYVVEWATTPKQMIYAGLRDRPQLDLSYFSLLVVKVSEPKNCYER